MATGSAGRSRSLRWRLVGATVVVQVLLLALLIFNSHRILHDNLVEQARAHIDALNPLFRAALVGPLVQRDLATLQDFVREVRRDHSIDYMLLTDHSGAVLAAEGWDPRQPPPAPEEDVHGILHGSSAERFDTFSRITLAGQHYGTLHFGFSLASLEAAEASLLRQSLTIAVIEILACVVLLSLTGLYLTRHLTRLTHAARRIAGGDVATVLRVESEDEVGALTRAFNAMAKSVQDHVADIEVSETRYRALALTAQQEQARMSSLLSAMSVGILFEDKNGKVIYVNPAMRRIWRIPEQTDLHGVPSIEFTRYSPNVLARPDRFSRHILAVTATQEVSESFEIVLADGRVLAQLTYPVRDADSSIIGRLWLYEDVTRERQTAEQLIYLAERDSLTGLYNRHRFQTEMSRMLSSGERVDRTGALLSFDLDEFKYVNDTHGHRAGDAMLIRIAGEVSTLIRRNEVFARLGGDEFAVLIPEASEEQAITLAERIVSSVSKIPFRLEGQNLRLTASLGIAMYPAHGRSPEELVSHADAAMYQAKESGRNAWSVYQPELDDSRAQLRRMNWQDRIARALDNGLLRLHFQGVYLTGTRELSHIEALVRMVDEEDPERLIMPGHFISIAERSGQIVNIDRWVIAEAVTILARNESLSAIAINISARSFDVPGLAGEIAQCLARHGVAPQRLIVELTETAAVSDLQDAQRFIEALHRHGCTVCLDDFGTGFSSFAYVKHLAVDALKIDGLFIQDLPNDRDNQILVRAITEVAKGLRKTTVAEYVEDEETLLMLQEIGVDAVQGYHLDMPSEDHPALRPRADTAGP